MVAPGSSTVDFMRTKVRRLTTSPNESSLSTNSIDQYLNNVINTDFPYAIKIDQLRSVYTFFTEPYRDRYPIDVNYNQGVRPPVYFEGILGTLFKDRTQFFNLWPKWPTKFQQGTSQLEGVITGISQPDLNTSITSPNHNLSTGAVILIDNVSGMTQLNGNAYTITVLDSNTFSLNGIDNTSFGTYTGGGTWVSNVQTFSFVIPGPFLSKEVVIGGVDVFGNPITINDNGVGILQYLNPNPIVSIPLQNLNPAQPGMYNINTGNPGLLNPTNIGTVDYVTGQINFTLPFGISLGDDQLFTIWVSQYQPGRPYCLLFWNNEMQIRPVPKLIHKVEVETYLTPVQFLNSTDVPILNQWAQYIAYIASMEILRDRNDFEGVENLREGMMRQEGLVLERQSVEEIGTPNYQLFNSTQAYSVYGGWGQGYC